MKDVNKLISFLIALLPLFSIAQNVEILSITIFAENSARPEISPSGSRIAFHERGRDNYYDVFVMNADGSNKTCLTCDNNSLPGKHAGQPSWSPDEKWIVFQAEKSDHVLPKIGALAAPGIGYHNDIYIMNIETGAITQLTNIPTKIKVGDKTPSGAILQPHFSHDGRKISWSQRVADGGEWGQWVVKVAEIDFSSTGLVLKNIVEFAPGANSGYIESNDFMPGDSTLLVCGNLEKNQTETGIDIYLLNLNSGRFQRLTNTLEYFDECPHPSPDGTKICYLSTEGFPNGDSKQWWNWARGEFWIMNADGSKKQQITHFNTPGYPECSGKRTIPEYISWSPDGKTILVAVGIEYKKRKIKEQIWKIQLK